jgi:hypothetical protein
MRIPQSASLTVCLLCFASGFRFAASQQAQRPDFAAVGEAQEAGTLPEQMAGAQPDGSLERDIQSLSQLEANYLRAEMEDNTTLAASIMADDYVGVRGDGSTSFKDDVLGNLAKHDRRREPLAITAVNMREHIFGDTACVTYTKIYTVTRTRATYSESVMHIFTKRGDQWHLQVSSPIPSPRPMPAPRAAPPPQQP